MKVMLLGAHWQQSVPKGCCCTWGAGLGKAISLWMSPWQRTCSCGVPRAESLQALMQCRLFTSAKGELLQIPFLVGEADIRRSCQSHTEESKHLLLQSCTPAYSATALLGLHNGRKQNQPLLIFCGGKEESALLESCLHPIEVAMQTVPLAWQGVEMCASYPLVCFGLLSSSLQSVTPCSEVSTRRAPGASQLPRDSRVSSGRGRPGALDK